MVVVMGTLATRIQLLGSTRMTMPMSDLHKTEPKPAPAPQPVATRAANPAPVALMTPASEIKHRPIDWLWPGRIARRKLTLLAGASGSGKSTLAMRIIAAVTSGSAYPCQEGNAPKGAAILVAPDGDPDVLIPGLKAAGADLARVQIIRQVQGAKGPRRFDLATDLPLLDAAARGIKDLRVIIIEGVSFPTRRAAAQATRAQLDALADLAHAHDASVMAVLQPAGTGRVAGRPLCIDPLALGAARAALVIEADPADKTRRLLLQVKNELAPEPRTLAFHVAAQEIGPGQSTARIEFEPRHHPLHARELVARQERGFNSAKAEAVEFLRTVFGGATRMHVRQIDDEARAAGLIKPNQTLTQSRTLRDARMAMGLVMAREGSGGGAWVWAMPGGDDGMPQNTLPNPAAASPPPRPARDAVQHALTAAA